MQHFKEKEELAAPVSVVGLTMQQLSCAPTGARAFRLEMMELNFREMPGIPVLCLCLDFVYGVPPSHRDKPANFLKTIPADNLRRTSRMIFRHDDRVPTPLCFLQI